MQIERFHADDFRNLSAVEIAPHPHFNIVQGDNGQGKTNVLEALYLLAGLRSFRTSRLAECIRFDTDKATIAARLLRAQVHSDLGIEIGRRRSRVFLDAKLSRRNADYLGRLVVVLFTPDDLRLPHGEPASRRRYLDRAIFNHQPGYLEELRHYERALSQRNALLRDADPGRIDLELLGVFDGLVADAGAVIADRRAQFVASFSPRVATHFSEVAAPGLSASLQINSRLGAKGPVGIESYSQLLRQALVDGRARDLRRRFTGSGPHLDDLVLMIQERPARIHASQGQCRALMLAMKIAEIRSLEERLGEAPVLLMDDVSSELDRQRNQALMAHLDALGGQVFLTTTDAAHIGLTASRVVFVMNSGRCVVQNSSEEGEGAGISD